MTTKNPRARLKEFTAEFVESQRDKNRGSRKSAVKFAKLAVAFMRPEFEAAGLNIAIDGHWKILAIILAIALRPKKPGRKPKWNVRKVTELRSQIDELKRAHPRKSDGALCDLLVKSSNVVDLKAETLRRRLHKSSDRRRPH